LLSSVSISVNNLKLSVTNDNLLEIETHGPWQGTAEQFLDILSEIVNASDGEDKQ
jgi:hypothetical protein